MFNNYYTLKYTCYDFFLMLITYPFLELPNTHKVTTLLKLV